LRAARTEGVGGVLTRFDVCVCVSCKLYKKMNKESCGARVLHEEGSQVKGQQRKRGVDLILGSMHASGVFMI